MNNYHKRTSAFCFFRKQCEKRNIGRAYGLPKCTGVWEPAKPYRAGGGIPLEMQDFLTEPSKNIWRTIVADITEKRLCENSLEYIFCSAWMQNEVQRIRLKFHI